MLVSFCVVTILKDRGHRQHPVTVRCDKMPACSPKVYSLSHCCHVLADFAHLRA